MRKFVKTWAYRTPLVTVEFPAGHETEDAEVIAAADKAGVLEIAGESDNGDGNDNGPATRSKAGRINYLKG
jgi:hypothetical protein